MLKLGRKAKANGLEGPKHNIDIEGAPMDGNSSALATLVIFSDFRIAKDFTKKNKNIKVRVVQSPNGSANAKTDVGKDPSKAADVFEVPNDQLGQMAEAGYINPLSPSATKDIKANYISVASKGVTWKNKIYAFPYAQQAQTFYYNKSKLSANDVKDWKTLTSKGVASY